MKIGLTLSQALLLWALCVPVHAGGPHDTERPAAAGLVQERDVALLFDYLKDSIDAAFDGRVAAPPEALTRRAEEIGEELKQHGRAAARSLVESLESTVREGLDTPKPPAIAPGQIRL